MPEEDTNESMDNSEIPSTITEDNPNAEVIPEGAEEEFEYDDGEYDEGFVDRVDSLMNDLNLDRKHFVIFSGCIVLLVIGIVISFILLFKLFGNEPDEIVATTPVAVEEVKEKKGFLWGLFKKNDNNNDNDGGEVVIPEPVEVTDDTEPVETDDTSVTAPVEFGDLADLPEYESVAIRSTIYYGLSDISEDRLAFYVRTYRKVRNIFNTDLFNYLNSLESRDQGYEDFLAQFKGANEQSKLAFDELRQDIEVFTQRLNKLNDDSIIIEQQFFEAVDNLDSEAIPDILDAFQDITSKKSIVKSELAARQAIGEKYARALPIIEKKIEAIEINKDPFIKGVKVVEFEQVDLDLIIQGE